MLPSNTPIHCPLLDEKNDIFENRIVDDDNYIRRQKNMFKYTLLYSNIRSLSMNIIHLRNLARELDPDFKSLTETFNPLPNYVKIVDYHDVILKNRHNSSWGGCGFYLKSKYSYSMVDKINTLKLIILEVLAVKVSMINSNVTIVTVYRPPDARICDSMEDIEKIMSQIDDERVIFSGDFNIDVLKYNSTSVKYLDKILSHNLHQIVNCPTRITHKTRSCIDNIITNINKAKSMVCHHQISDHQIVLCLFDKQELNLINSNKPTHKDRINYSKSIDNIRNIDWKEWAQKNESCDIDIDSTYSSFHTLIKESLVFEKKKINKRKVPVEPWMTVEILKVKRKMDYLRKKFLKHNSEKNENDYKNVKRQYSFDIRNAKNNYFGNELFKARKDSKKIWSIIHQLIHGKSKSDQIEYIKVKDVLMNEDKMIAETFSDYYKFAAINKINEIKTDIDFAQFLSTDDLRNDTFKLEDVNLEDVWNIIKSIKPKSSSGIDSIPAKLVCKAATAFLLPMKVIINKSFASGKFPDLLKTSKVTPIPKDKTFEIQNFRPLAQQSIFSKIIEKCALKQMTLHDKNHFIERHQYSYKENHNTVQPILLARHQIERSLEKICL